jgi:HPt (histidine-containing phosphotransfer) domain-containing protein
MASSALQRSEPEAAAQVVRHPIDHVHLARYTFGNRALEVEVLQLFAAQAPLYLDLLRSAETVKDWRDAAHTLKGSARAVGAFAVAEMSERAESLRDCPDSAQRLRAVEALAASLAETCAYIDGLQA